jgi:hypothetical protein
VQDSDPNPIGLLEHRTLQVKTLKDRIMRLNYQAPIITDLRALTPSGEINYLYSPSFPIFLIYFRFTVIARYLSDTVYTNAIESLERNRTFRLISKLTTLFQSIKLQN